MTQTWFITGSSRGLGRAITVAALEAGDSVVATARRLDDVSDLVARWGDRVLPLRLDVTDATSAREALETARTQFGRIDVVVNNAGYANLAPIESASPDDFRAQFETNFWGVYNVSRAAVPLFRQQRGGLIMQISSMGGRVGGSPGLGSYQAAKFAIDGFSRVLRAETAPFGVQVVVVEPSGFRTDWAGSSMTVHDAPAEYAETVTAVHEQFRALPEMSPGLPERAAEILVRVARHSDIPHHLPLGVVASEGSIALDRELQLQDRRWSSVSRSADAGQPYPVPLPGENSTVEERGFSAALDEAARLLGRRLEPFLTQPEGAPSNADDFMRIATVQAFGDAWPRRSHIDTRTRALASVAITATLGTLEPLRGQLRIALANGATPEEVVEVFVQIAAYAGVARAFEGYGIAAEVFEERR